MRVGIRGFSGARLLEARSARGLSQSSLAQLIERSSSSISKWEAGDQLPELEALEALARALNVRSTYFMKAPSEHTSPFFFRSISSETKSIRQKARVRISWLEELSCFVQEWLDLPELNVPDAKVSNFKSLTDDDIDQIAKSVRDEWGLGSGPIPDLLLAFENAGIVCGYEEIDSAKMDGLSTWSSGDGRPYILLNSFKNNYFRSRFDAAHELGHIVLHRNVNEKNIGNVRDFSFIEKQAHRFAGAFLLPEESISEEIFSVEVTSFLPLKKRWKTSIAAMLVRAEQIGMISQSYKPKVWRQMARRGWRRHEPYDSDFAPEKPRLMNRSIRMLIDQNIIKKKSFLETFSLSPNDIESLSGLPKNYFRSDGDISDLQISLKKKLNDKDKISKSADEPGKVIAFPKKESSLE